MPSPSAAAFEGAYEQLRRPGEEVALADWLSLVFSPDKDGIAAIFERGGEVPAKRLGQIRTAMRDLLMGDASDRMDGPAQQ